MALAWTQNTLLQALRDWPVEQDNDEYENNLENLVGLGEIRLVRDLNLSIFDVVDDTLTIDEGERLVTKPAGIITTRSLRLGQVITTQVEAAADDDSICLAQSVSHAAAAMSLNGAAVSVGVATFTVAREVSVLETTLNEGGLRVTITGTDSRGFPASELVNTAGKGATAFTRTLFLTVTGVQASGGDGTRAVKVGGAVARGAVVIGETWPLELRSRQYCDAYAPDRREVGRPAFFNEISTTQWELVDAADQDYAVIAEIVKRPAGLMDGAPTATTWLSSSVPDALLSACLMEAEKYLKADDRFADMQSEYEGKQVPAARMELRNLIRLGDRGPFQAAMAPA